MKPTRVFNRLGSWLAVLLVFLTVRSARAADNSVQGLALARYFAAGQRPDPFEQSGAVLISIEASLPELYKEASVVAVRAPGEKGQAKYGILDVDGDGAVLTEVVGRYFQVEQQMADLRTSPTAITPKNYKFRFKGEVGAEGVSAYIYRITPKKSGPGLSAGQVWMDSSSGAEVMLRGRLTKMPSVGRRAELVRDTKLLNGSAYERVTHLAFVVPQLGRAEVVVRELLLPLQNAPSENRGQKSVLSATAN